MENFKSFEEFLAEKKCWPGYKKKGTKIEDGKKVNNCVSESDEGIDEGIDFVFEYEEIDSNDLMEVISESTTPERTKSGKIKYRGELFAGYNKPKRYRGPKKYKFRVLAKDGDKIRIVNFGHKDFKDFTQHKDTDRRRSFRKRMKCDPVKSLDKTSARYWACQFLW